MKYIFGLLFGLSLSSVFAQSSIEDLKKYCHLLSKQEVDSSMAYVHPKIFEALPKEEFAEQISSIYGDSSMTITFGEPTNIKLKKKFEIEKVQYEMVSYEFMMEILFKDSTTTNTQRDFMFEVMKAQYGKKNVVQDLAKRAIQINVKSKNIAILDPSMENWVFVNYLSKKDPMLMTLLSDKARRKI